MNSRMSKFTHALISFGLVATVGVIHADDTEIYVGFSNANEGAQPNVLFILDSSGSMGTGVTITQSYDPSVTYTGTCAADRIFWRKSGDDTPECSTDEYFLKSQFRCDAAGTVLDIAGAGAGTGFFQDRAAWWDSDREEWQDLDKDEHNPPHVECKADSGIHGQTTGSAAKYIAEDSSGPWQASSSGSLDWNSTGDVYVMYNANYLNWFHNHSVTVVSTRIQTVKDVTKNVINSVTDINVGLMRFDPHLYPPFGNADSEGGPVLFPITDIDAAGTRTAFNAAVDGLTAQSSTPLSETLREALGYYTGGPVHYGDFAANTFQSVASSREPANFNQYKTPIDNECGRHFIVLLSDGQPTADNSSDAFINALLSGPGAPTNLDLGSCDHGPDYTATTADDTCLDELAEYMFEKDHVDDSVIPGKQNIVTYTVGFGLAGFNDFLVSAATEGGGKSYLADNAAELTTAFTDILTEILSVNTTFTAPAVSVNAFNRITNSKELYFAIFKPKSRPQWDGNVKKFQLAVINGVVKIVDALGVEAVDQLTGFFKPNATSIWTKSHHAPDGDEAKVGGFGSRLYDLAGTQQTAASRKIYTNVHPPSALTNSNNVLNVSNALTPTNPGGKITAALLGMATATVAEFLKVVAWASGVDVDDDDMDGSTTDGRDGVGAPLHARPAVATYSKTGPVAGTQRDVLFSITNDGYFHAAEVHESPGNNNKLEIFSFVPKELLANLNILYEDTPGTQTTPNSTIQYGLDGGIEVWTRDVDQDGEIESADGDHVYVYFNQRRGGPGYYALDVTNLAAPTVLWSIIGGTTAGFGELAGSWSKPERHKMKLLLGGSIVEKDVIVFGAGYDTGHDTSGTARSPTGDSSGRAIYIVDAVTGSVLWWAGHSSLASPSPDLSMSEMKYAIPAEIRVIDVNGDGLAERMYTGDMGGQVLRFDVNPDGTITGGLIADLQDNDGLAGTDPVAADNRRFYYPPDIAFVESPEQGDYLSIAIGSGYRAHPNNKTVGERFFLLRDHNINAAPTNGAGNIDYSTMKVSAGDLLDITDEPQLDVAGLSSVDAAKFDSGWYLSLEDLSSGSVVGEKVTERALTVDGKILFTTFTPVSAAGQSSGACSPSQGQGKLYSVNIDDGTPSQNLDAIGAENNLTTTDRFLTLTRPGIPPEPTVVFPPFAGIDPLTLVGAEIADINLTNSAVKTYWYQDNVY